jgi:hypothetical protein
MRAFLALLAAMTASAPAAPVVSYDPATNFDHYRNYSWVFPHPPANMDQTLYRQVHAAIDHSLGAHGFGKSSPGDFAVAFTVGPRSNMHASDFGNYAFYYSGDEAASHRNWVNSEMAQRVDHDDTLSIDIYDTATKHSIWHGIAAVPVVSNTRQGIIEHEVNDVLSLFPPRNR